MQFLEPTKSIRPNHPSCHFSGSAFERDLYRSNAEPECHVWFKQVLNLEPELGVQFGPVQVRTDF